MVRLDEASKTEFDELPELPADVVVPDDLRTLGQSERETARRPVRWLRWMALAVVAAGAIAVAAIGLRSDEVVDVVAPPMVTWSQTDGPGSSSWAAVAPPWEGSGVTSTPWPAGEGPGSSSWTATALS